MRLAELDADSWTLRSGEESHAANPESFWIPSEDERRSLRRGQAARLIFEIEGYEEDGSVGLQAERMWVIVAQVVGGLYVGILDNQPACLDPASDAYLRFGTEVPFGPEHVIDVASPPQDYVDWQLGQPPEHSWPR